MIRDQVVDYARAASTATVTGQEIDHAHPTVMATTEEGKELVVADAKSRCWRTLMQGLIFDVFAAIVAAIAMLSRDGSARQGDLDILRRVAVEKSW